MSHLYTPPVCLIYIQDLYKQSLTGDLSRKGKKVGGRINRKISIGIQGIKIIINYLRVDVHIHILLKVCLCAFYMQKGLSAHTEK